MIVTPAICEDVLFFYYRAPTMAIRGISLLLRYGCAAGSVGVATWGRLLLDPVLGNQLPFATILLAVLATSWSAGFRPALVAAILGALSTFLLIIRPQGSFFPVGMDQLVGMVLYGCLSLGIAFVGGALRTANERLENRVRERTAELTRTNESLQASEERFRLLIEGAQDYANFMLDPGGHVITWNTGAERLKGYQADEIRGRHFSCFYSEQDVACGKPEQELHQALTEGRCLDEGWRIRKDGSRFWARVVITPLHDNAGQLRGFAKITRDITEGMRAEERFRQAVESAPNGMVMINSDGIIVLVNAQTEKLFGYDRKELLGQPVEILVPERFRGRHPEHRKGFFAQPQVRSMGVGRDLYGRRKDGSEFPVEIGLNPINTQEGLLVLSAIVDITERKQMESAMRDSEERFRMMANSIPQLACIARADGHIIWFNRRWYEFTGTTPAQMEGWGWQSVHDPAVLPEVMARWKDAIDAGKPFEMVFPLRGAHGQFRTFLTRVEPFRDSEGRVVQWFGTNTDVEELKRLEESLRASQARLNSTLAAGSIGTWTWDIANDRLTADEFTAIMFSIEPDAAESGLPAKDYILAIKEEDQPLVADALARAIQSCGHYDIEYRVRQKDGGLRWLQAKGRVEGDSAGNALYFHGAVMDITERKRTDEALKESEARLKLFITHAPAALAVFDRDMRYLAVSRRWLSDYGLGDGNIIGRSHVEIFPEIPDRWKAVYGRGFAGEIVQADEDSFERADGSVQWLRWEVRPWPAADGTVGGIVLFTEDISERKHVEQALQKVHEELEGRVVERTAQLEAANKELEAFSYSVSHDLRAPLRAIAGFSKILLKSYAEILPPKAQEYLQDVSRNTLHMGHLVDDLLAFSRLSRQPVKKIPVITCDLVRQCLAELRNDFAERQVDIRIGDLPPCMADPALLKQVWVNLLANAIKYSNKRESALIEIGSLACDQPGKRTYFVKDNGVGFDMEYAHKLFGVFQRLHRSEDYEGTGVGLAIVQRIIHRHGGRVWAEAEPDRGATFFFTL